MLFRSWRWGAVGSNPGLSGCKSVCSTIGLPEYGHGLAPKYTRFRVRKCFQKLCENCCRLSFLICYRLVPEVILCLESFFIVKHGLRVDFWSKRKTFYHFPGRFLDILRTFFGHLLVTFRTFSGYFPDIFRHIFPDPLPPAQNVRGAIGCGDHEIGRAHV